MFREPVGLLAIQEMLMQTEADGGEMGPLMIQSAYPQYFRSMIGCSAYSHLPILRSDGKIDVAFNGRHSCAYFVTAVLHHFGLIDHWNQWVREVPPLLRTAGWYEISASSISVGDIIIYVEYAGTQHIAFYDGDEQAISTALLPEQFELSVEEQRGAHRTPQRHHWLYEGRPDGPRQVESIWTHKVLQQ